MPVPAEMEPRLSPAEVAEIWGVDYQTVYRLLKTGKLVGFRVGAKWRIAPESLRAYETEHRQQQTAPPPVAKRRIVTKIY